MARASLPPRGYQRPATRFDDGARIVVRAYPEDGSASKDFTFHTWPVGRDLQLLFADGFENATGSGGSRRTQQSAKSLHSSLRKFAQTLSEQAMPPTTRSELRASHLSSLRLLGTKTSTQTLHSVRVVLRSTPDVPEDFRARLFAPLRSALPTQPVSSYTESEYRSIARQARAHVRVAASRIRAGEARLARWRAGKVDRHTERREYDFGVALDQLARSGDVPRTAGGAVAREALTQANALHETLFLTTSEAAAFVVLLQCLTGLNLGTVLGLGASYSRTDSGTGGESVSIITAASKPRRGPYAAEMSMHLAGRPRSQGAGVNPRDDLTTAYGVYMLAHQLSERARNFAHSSALIVGHSATRASGTEGGLGFRSPSSHSLSVLAYIRDQDDRLRPPDSMRLRKTVLQKLQRPVAQSAATLAGTYLARDPTALPENQALVARALADEVDRVRSIAVGASLTTADVEEAKTRPTAVAERFGISAETLAHLLEGRLDTVATACVDHTNSPHTPVGQPCTASFLLCIGCPCSRSEPRHIPVQALLAMQIESERSTLGTEAWTSRFRTASEGLADLLSEQRVDIAAAQELVSANDRTLVDALVSGDLDIR